MKKDPLCYFNFFYMERFCWSLPAPELYSCLLEILKIKPKSYHYEIENINTTRPFPCQVFPVLVMLSPQRYITIIIDLI